MMTIKVFQHKRNDEQIAIVRVVKQNVKAVSVRVMAKSSTMLAPIARVDSRMWQLGSPAAMLIVYASRLVLK